MSKGKKEQKLKLLPVGQDDFESLITENYYFVDKSLFIKEVLDSGAVATLLPRPRRFGKTLNMSMLKCFFEKAKKSRVHLFDNLAISRHKDIMQHQGKYPVIFITLKSAEDMTWKGCLFVLKQIISELYTDHSYLLNATFLNTKQKKDFKDIMSMDASELIYRRSLKALSEYLHKYHKIKTIILIDEYDVPLHSGYRYGYFGKATLFIKQLLSDALKGNSNLKFSVLTGALRVAKESIFTGLNHLEVHTIFSDLYSDKFGLLEAEVKELLNYYSLKNKMSDIRLWYNGYSSGQFTIYNPWSIINLAKNQGKLQPYWINTSSNDIVRDLIKDGDETVKENIEQLIQGESISKEISEDIVYTEIKENETSLWNFLLFTGYLTYKKKSITENYADFFIPNREILRFFESAILSWFGKHNVKASYNKMLRSLTDGDIQTFGKFFTRIVTESFSFFDTSGKYPEKFYHACVLGMLISLSDSFEVRSNRESGDGRYDVMLIPKDKSKLGIVIEFKKVDTSEKETLKQAAASALKQIKNKNYATELFSKGIKSVAAIGIAFQGKKVLIQSKKI